EEFVAAGDFLAYKFPQDRGQRLSISCGVAIVSQYLVTRGVPCLRRETCLVYIGADEDAERFLSFRELQRGRRLGRNTCWS
ncbi:hypothetical protein B0H12DRAFT_1022769, partial [Mycena haematopus]